MIKKYKIRAGETLAIKYKDSRAVAFALGNFAELEPADLDWKANLRRADLRWANLSEADLIGANLRRADLYRADLRGANLIGANLRGANLRRADLYRADLIGANLIGANLRGANLRRADLYRADLRGANLTGADLIGANLDFACWPLWCGSFGLGETDDRLTAQLVRHAMEVAAANKSEYGLAVLAALSPLDKFHEYREDVDAMKRDKSDG